MFSLVGYVLSERMNKSGKSKKKRDYILSFPGIMDRESASRLLGKEIVYKDGSVKIRGRILSHHGIRGKVRARFLKPLPGEFWRGRVYLQVDKSLLVEFSNMVTSSRTV